jgi:Leucine-rich repeat (LRR) protein
VIENYALINLTKLVQLDLHQNKLTSFEEIPKSFELDSLILAFNFISSLSNLDNCPNLSVLDLHNNRISELSGEVLHLKNLKTLNLSNNDLSDLPPQLALLDQLVRIQIEGNPLKSIKSTMRTANAVQLKKYL